MSKRVRHQPGERFGSLVLVKTFNDSPNDRGWIVQCDCGNVVKKKIANLTNGKTRTCADRSRHQTGPAGKAPCSDCGRIMKGAYCRGLCSTCYKRALDEGSVHDFERLKRSREEVIEEWEWLRSEGYTMRQAAERLGMKYNSLYAVLWRARKAAEAEERDEQRAA